MTMHYNNFTDNLNIVFHHASQFMAVICSCSRRRLEKDVTKLIGCVWAKGVSFVLKRTWQWHHGVPSALPFVTSELFPPCSCHIIPLMYTQSQQKQDFSFLLTDTAPFPSFLFFFFVELVSLFLLLARTSHDCLQHALSSCTLCNVLRRFPGQLSCVHVPPGRVARTLLWLHYCSFFFFFSCIPLSSCAHLVLTLVRATGLVLRLSLAAAGYAYWGPGCTVCVVGTALQYLFALFFFLLRSGGFGTLEVGWGVHMSLTLRSVLAICSCYCECSGPLFAFRKGVSVRALGCPWSFLHVAGACF